MKANDNQPGSSRILGLRQKARLRRALVIREQHLAARLFLAPGRADCHFGDVLRACQTITGSIQIESLGVRVTGCQ
jgi:hypothetical protein